MGGDAAAVVDLRPWSLARSRTPLFFSSAEALRTWVGRPEDLVTLRAALT
jgi:hypothetical protein